MSCHNYDSVHSRRDFLAKTGLGLGAAALAQLLGREAFAASDIVAPSASPGAGVGGLPGLPHFAPKAKRVICLFQSGGPSHLDLFDDKPVLRARFNEDLPDSIRRGQRITGMVASQARLAVQPSKWAFQPGGRSGTSISDLLPHTRAIADDLCVVRSMHADDISHDGGIMFMNTGAARLSRPSLTQNTSSARSGFWMSKGSSRTSTA